MDYEDDYLNVLLDEFTTPKDSTFSMEQGFSTPQGNMFSPIPSVQEAFPTNFESIIPSIPSQSQFFGEWIGNQHPNSSISFDPTDLAIDPIVGNNGHFQMSNDQPAFIHNHDHSSPPPSNISINPHIDRHVLFASIDSTLPTQQNFTGLGVGCPPPHVSPPPPPPPPPPPAPPQQQQQQQHLSLDTVLLDQECFPPQGVGHLPPRPVKNQDKLSLASYFGFKKRSRKLIFSNFKNLNSTPDNSTFNSMEQNWEGINSYLVGQVRSGPDVPCIYKCKICNIEFPNAQAFGGHMSSHTKAKKKKTSTTVVPTNK